jgi:GNAT superfamily N-acetyltransferase
MSSPPATVLATAVAPPTPPVAPPRRVAFIGNSYQYYNDLPRLFQVLTVADDAITSSSAGQDGRVTINDCLRGGTSIPSLLAQGNGMRNKFSSRPASRSPGGSYDIGAPTVSDLLTARGPWDALIINDYSQAATRPRTRAESVAALETEIAPMIVAASRGGGAGEGEWCVTVLMEVAAYREQINNSAELGTWADFTAKQDEGYRVYRDALAAALPPAAPLHAVRIANVNAAFAAVRGDNEALWRDLYAEDDYHPSAVGTFFQACCVFAALYGRPPRVPEHFLAAPEDMWAGARYMLPPPAKGRMPSREEMAYLAEVAEKVVCGGSGSGSVGGGVGGGAGDVGVGASASATRSLPPSSSSSLSRTYTFRTAVLADLDELHAMIEASYQQDDAPFIDYDLVVKRESSGDAAGPASYTRTSRSELKGMMDGSGGGFFRITRDPESGAIAACLHLTVNGVERKEGEGEDNSKGGGAGAKGGHGGEAGAKLWTHDVRNSERGVTDISMGMLAVALSHRSQGMGHVLLREAERVAREMGVTALTAFVIDPSHPPGKEWLLQVRLVPNVELDISINIVSCTMVTRLNHTVSFP